MSEIKFPQRRTVPIVRWRQFEGQRAAITTLNSETELECLTFAPDEKGEWFAQLRIDDMVTVDVERPADRPKNYIGKVAPLSKQPNVLQTAIRKRQRGQENLRRSDIELSPDLAEALQYARRLVGDPDTKTYASRVMTVHLAPFLDRMKANQASSDSSKL